MDIRIILLIFLVIVSFFDCEGFINLYQRNFSEESNYPDKNQFYPVHNHNKVKIGNDELMILGNNNYKVINNSVKEPLSGSFSAFLDVNKIRTFDHFFRSPITDKKYGFDVSYERQYEYDIIQNEDNNKKELLRKEKENDLLINNPYYLYGHPKNNSKILYSEELQDLFLKYKNTTNRYEDIGHSPSIQYDNIN